MVFANHSFMSQNAVEITGLKKVYKNGFKALKGVDMTIKEGDFFALLGANGAGKTTIIGILTGTVLKTEGTVKVFGVDIDKNHNEAKKLIGVVPQEFNFNIFEKVQDIIIQQAGYFGIPRSEAKKRIKPILEVLELWDKRHTKAMELSGGMKRRLMIARALIHGPKFLILDEPTAGVDVELRHGMWDYLKKINKEGVTILLTTHYIEEAEELCRNVAIIKLGEIIKSAPTRELTNGMEEHTYVVELSEKHETITLKGFEFERVDETTIEVVVKKDQTINQLIQALDESKIVVHELSPKGNKLERLFLKLVTD